MKNLFLIFFIIFILSLQGTVFAFEKGEERFYVAVKAFNDGFYEASLSLFKKFLDDFSENPYKYEAKLYSAKCYYHMENYPEALNILIEL
ncbi:MAG: hypothetical protein JW867_09200, partial [Candidatus Omnitrophica bacterium]|nr:hypothetical protein [Candidatus Omnitrophota bacterium]